MSSLRRPPAYPKLTHFSQSLLFFWLLLCSPLSAVSLAAAPPVPALARQLSDRAQTALVKGQVQLATVLLRGAWEIARDVELLQQLARAYTMVGLFEEAIESYETLLRHSPPEALRAQVEAEVKRLRGTPSPFSDALLAHGRATAEAKLAFDAGMRLSRQKKLQESIQYLRAALVLDPTLPGTYRVLGAIHGQLGDPVREQEFLLDYLRIRPDGQIADTVRTRLKTSGVLSSTTIEASFPSKVWINGRPMELTTPVKGLLLPAGSHTISFVNEEFHIIRNMRVRLTAGEKRRVSFDFGVLQLKLAPWARARANGKDLGLWESIGLPAGRYEIKLTAHDNSRRKSLTATIAAGQTLTVSGW